MTSIGRYGVVAFTNARRTNQLWIRLALGAGRGWVVRMVVRQKSAAMDGPLFCSFRTDTIICSDCEALVGSQRAFSQPTMKAADVGLPDAVADGSTLKTARRTPYFPQ